MSDLVPSTGELYPVNNPYEYGNAYSRVPAHLEAVPEYGPTNGFTDTVGRYWSYVIRYPRYAALGFLWITYTPWRFLYLVGTGVLLYVSLTSG
ncbi:hypothetical protein GCM10010156_55320 [Planobispora rosea]|uniref:Uncharacterized protein n=1 Tax=Planobispora rosea TaxID=35762 RepID=A0A8J3S4N6_PLARO|nr:hypothetical protein [Planobispora rosea]GGS89838.1 hypothetical protein GCM10010156_55320 [Planobispora rosea]GIH86730.1 hypothetical protein Pro02_51380 [Planobispora rosea]